jgi:hypothetical protein
VIAAGAHLVLATLLENGALALIVASTVLFGLGRLVFLAGYTGGAAGRAFGMATTFLPTGAGYALAMGCCWRTRPASSASGALRESLFRRAPAQPAVHGGEPVDLRALREHTRRTVRASRVRYDMVATYRRMC